MKPLLTLPGARKANGNPPPADARGRLFDGKIEVDLRRCKPKAAVASEDIDERVARRALDVEGWVARRRARDAE